MDRTRNTRKNAWLLMPAVRRSVPCGGVTPQLLLELAFFKEAVESHLQPPVTGMFATAEDVLAAKFSGGPSAGGGPGAGPDPHRDTHAVNACRHAVPTSWTFSGASMRWQTRTI